MPSFSSPLSSSSSISYEHEFQVLELGPDALTAFTETKNVFISTEGPAQ